MRSEINFRLATETSLFIITTNTANPPRPLGDNGMIDGVDISPRREQARLGVRSRKSEATTREARPMPLASIHPSALTPIGLGAAERQESLRGKKKKEDGVAQARGLE